MDLFGRKILLEVMNELPKAPSTLSDRIGERTIEFAVKQKLPVFGIEAHDIRRQHIHAEIRRELRNRFAIMLCKLVSEIARHEVSTRKANSPVAMPPSSSLRSRLSPAALSSHAGRTHHLESAANKIAAG